MAGRNKSARAGLARAGRSAIEASAPPTGEPVGKKATSGGGGPVNRFGGSQQLSVNEAIGATTSTVQQIFNEAASGRTTRLLDLYKHSRVHDSRLDAVSSTRVLAIQSRGYVLRTPPGFEHDSRALEITKHVASNLNEVRGLQTLIGHLAHGVLEHLAVLQHRWYQNRRGLWNSQPFWIHPNRAGWKLPDVEACWSVTETGTDDNGQRVAGRPFSEWPDRFVVFSPVAGRSDYPWMRGALRSRVAASVVKRMGLRWWLQMIERWGQPQVIAYRTDEATSDAEGAEVIAALRMMGTDWRASLPQGWDVRTIPINLVSDLHSRYVDHHDREDGIAILGQNLTTDIPKGGSYAAAKAHQHVRLDILASDLLEIAEVITDQWIRPMVGFNWGWDAPVPYFDFVLGSRDVITVQAYQAGLFSADEVRASMGHDPEINGTGKRYFVGVAPTTKTTGGDAP